MYSKKTIVGIIVLGSAIVEGAYYVFQWLRWKHCKHVVLAESKDCIHEVIFFPDQKLPCKSLYDPYYNCPNKSKSVMSNPCRFTHTATSLSKLMNYLNETKSSLDLCVFIITCPELANVIVTLFKRGIVIRVITDSQQVDAIGSQIGKMRAAGIPVRCNKSSYLMHHKFAIVDSDLLINGSFNWTTQAISGNNENVLITNSSSLVTSYRSEFEKLWSLFDYSKSSELKE